MTKTMTKTVLITEAFWHGWKAAIHLAQLISKSDKDVEEIFKTTAENLASEGLIKAIKELKGVEIEDE